MSQAGPVSRTERWLSAGYYMRRASPVDGWCDELRETGASLILVRRSHESLNGLLKWADPANAITSKNLSPVSQDPGIVIPGSRLTGLARLSCNHRGWFLLRLSNVPRSRQTDTSSADRASPAHVIRPLKPSLVVTRANSGRSIVLYIYPLLFKHCLYEKINKSNSFGCMVGFWKLLGLNQVFTTLDENWIAHPFYFSMRLKNI